MTCCISAISVLQLSRSKATRSGGCLLTLRPHSRSPYTWFIESSRAKFHSISIVFAGSCLSRHWNVVAQSSLALQSLDPLHPLHPLSASRTTTTTPISSTSPRPLSPVSPKLSHIHCDCVRNRPQDQHESFWTRHCKSHSNPSPSAPIATTIRPPRILRPSLCAISFPLSENVPTAF